VRRARDPRGMRGAPRTHGPSGDPQKAGAGTGAGAGAAMRRPLHSPRWWIRGLRRTRRRACCCALGRKCFSAGVWLCEWSI